MELTFDLDLAKDYTSNSQKIRVLTENWVSNSIYCPYCGASLTNCKNNEGARDFDCSKCNENYELKSKKGKSLGNKVNDGAYSTMIERINSSNNPNFYFLNYNAVNFSIINFCAVPKYFFLTDIIEKRKPLSINAKRAGWIGCNILISQIPNSGKIFYIKNNKVESKNKVLDTWNKTIFLNQTKNLEYKGWLLDVLYCIDKIEKTTFYLRDIYQFEDYLKSKHQNNNNIKAKIRQQLQVLRDKSYLIFEGNGKYKLR
jgi:type II restriction enzyme